MTEKTTIKVHAEIVNGECPTCKEITMLVGVTVDFFRCMNCGSDLKQHINGKISYIPHAANPKQIRFEAPKNG